MFNVDVRGFLDDVSVATNIKCKLRPSKLITDDYGIPISDEKPRYIKCNIVESQENTFNVQTNSYLVSTVYEIYLDYDSYGHLDFTGAEFYYNGRILQVVGIPLKHSYASHFILKATQKKVNDA